MQPESHPPLIYRPLRDPLLLASLVLYSLSRFLLRDLHMGSVFEAYAGDLLLIPICAPIMVFGLQCVGLRRRGDPPTGVEVMLLLVTVAAIFEGLLPSLPYFEEFSYADAWDLVMYAAGASLAAWWWSHWLRINRDRSTFTMRSPWEVFALSLFPTVAVLVISLVVSWQAYRLDFHAEDPQVMTHAVVQGYFDELRERVQQGATLPGSLSEMDQMVEDSWRDHLWGDAFGYFTWKKVQRYEVSSDLWGQPLIYGVEGDLFTIESLGRDGKVGGTGYDADIVGGRPLGSAARPSFGDFLADQPSGGMIDTSILASILTFFASVSLLRRRERPRLTLAALLGTMGGVTVVTVLLAGAHIPYYSGH